MLLCQLGVHMSNYHFCCQKNTMDTPKFSSVMSSLICIQNTHKKFYRPQVTWCFMPSQPLQSYQGISTSHKQVTTSCKQVTTNYSYWTLMSCQPHRVTSGQLNSVISKCIFSCLRLSQNKQKREREKKKMGLKGFPLPRWSFIRVTAGPHETHYGPTHLVTNGETMH